MLGVLESYETKYGLPLASSLTQEVEGNFASKYGAGAYVHGSLLEVTGGRVKANKLTGAGRGAGVAAFAGSTVRLAGGASVERPAAVERPAP